MDFESWGGLQTRSRPRQPEPDLDTPAGVKQHAKDQIQKLTQDVAFHRRMIAANEKKIAEWQKIVEL